MSDNVGEVSIFQHGLCISAMEHARMLLLSDNVLLATHVYTNYEIVLCLNDFVSCSKIIYIWCGGYISLILNNVRK